MEEVDVARVVDEYVEVGIRVLRRATKGKSSYLQSSLHARESNAMRHLAVARWLSDNTLQRMDVAFSSVQVRESKGTNRVNRETMQELLGEFDGNAKM